MNKFTLLKLLFFLLGLQMAFAQKLNVKTHTEKINNGYIIYADNNEYCPVSIRLDLSLNNMKSTMGNNKIFLLPANSKGNELTRLQSLKKGKYGYSYKTKFNYGDHFLNTYNKEFSYSLPYKKGTTEKISQGYNGNITHQNKNALDFDMADGTDIHAVRDGLVVKIIDHNTKSCHSQECQKYNNTVVIYHNDGTFAEYTHIQQKGAKVSIGDKVKQGEFIAKSGNVGWSSGPHLHFEVYLQKLERKKTIKTKFKTGDGKSIEYLQNQKMYSKLYE